MSERERKTARKVRTWNKLYVYGLKWLFTLAAHIKSRSINCCIRPTHFSTCSYFLFIAVFCIPNQIQSKNNALRTTCFHLPAICFCLSFQLSPCFRLPPLSAFISDFYFYESDFDIENVWMGEWVSEISISIPNTNLIPACILRLFCCHHLFWFYFIFFSFFIRYRKKNREKVHIWHLTICFLFLWVFLCAMLSHPHGLWMCVCVCTRWAPLKCGNFLQPSI